MSTSAETFSMSRYYNNCTKAPLDPLLPIYNNIVRHHEVIVDSDMTDFLPDIFLAEMLSMNRSLETLTIRSAGCNSEYLSNLLRAGPMEHPTLKKLIFEGISLEIEHFQIIAEIFWRSGVINHLIMIKNPNTLKKENMKILNEIFETREYMTWFTVYNCGIHLDALHVFNPMMNITNPRGLIHLDVETDNFYIEVCGGMLATGSC
jgi:hypothetical protein